MQQESLKEKLKYEKKSSQNMVAMETSSYVDSDMSYQIVAR